MTPQGARLDHSSLAGRTVVVTRAPAQAQSLVRALEARGARVIALPLIRIEPLGDLGALRLALADLPRYQWLVFTSRNTVDIVCDRMPGWGLGPADLARVSVAAIGPATADALRERGIAPALVPPRYVGEAVVEAFAALPGVSHARVLVPQAADARDVIPAGLRALGAVVDAIPVYRTVPEPGDGRALAADLLAGRVDAVTLASSSTVRAFVDRVGPAAARSGRYLAAAIGPVTGATARELGLAPVIEAPPSESTAAGLVEALVQHLR